MLFVASTLGNVLLTVGYMFNLFIYFLGADDAQLGLVFSISAICSIFASFVGGCLADRYDRRILFALGKYGMALGSLFYTLIGSWQLVIPIRIVDVIFVYIMAAAWRPLVADSVPSEKRGFTFSVLSAATAINWMIGSAIGGYVVELHGFNIMWYLDCLTHFLEATFALFFLKEAEHRVIEKRSLKSFVSRFNVFNVENRSLLAIYVLLLFFSLQSGLVSPFLPVYLEEDTGFSKSSVGLVGAVSNLILAATIIAVGKSSDKIGRRLPIFCFMCAGGVFLFLVPLVEGYVLVFALASLAYLGLSSWYLSSAIQPLVADLSRDEWRGRAMSSMFTIMSIGGIIGPAIGGWIWKTQHAGTPFILASLANVILAFLLMKLVSEPSGR
jgi:DHA1 family multidrug resistance protein-like MFS transporter